MSYQLYRNTTIGNTLQESLDELISYGQITPQLALKGKIENIDKCRQFSIISRLFLCFQCSYSLTNQSILRSPTR
jgi:hypothetical protein